MKHSNEDNRSPDMNSRPREYEAEVDTLEYDAQSTASTQHSVVFSKCFVFGIGVLRSNLMVYSSPSRERRRTRFLPHPFPFIIHSSL
jgi:hypothetical protein